MSLREIYCVKMEPFLDKRINRYINIITISDYPKGPLREKVKRIHKEKLSDKDTNNIEDDRCIYTIMSLKNDEQYMTIREITNLYVYLKKNNYDVNDVNLKWEKNVICFIEYFY